MKLTAEEVCEIAMDLTFLRALARNECEAEAEAVTGETVTEKLFRLAREGGAYEAEPAARAYAARVFGKEVA